MFTAHYRSFLVAILLAFPLLSTAQVDDTDEQGSFFDKIFFGGNASFRSNNGYTQLELAPMVGYRVTDRFLLGVSPTFVYARGSAVSGNGVVIQEAKALGYRLFTRYYLPTEEMLAGNSVFFHAEYEALRYSWRQSNSNTEPLPHWFYANFVGAGISQKIGGGRARLDLMVLYNLSYIQGQSLYNSPVIYRAGLTF